MQNYGPLSSTDQDHRINMSIILVTGGNRGIGLGIVEATTTRIPSATLIIGCRSLRNRGIQSKLEVVEMDIENDASIATAAEAVDKKYCKLDGMY